MFVCIGVPQDLKEAQTKKKVASENGFWSFTTQSSDGFQQTWNYLQKNPRSAIHHIQFYLFQMV